MRATAARNYQSPAFRYILISATSKGSFEFMYVPVYTCIYVHTQGVKLQQSCVGFLKTLYINEHQYIRAHILIYTHAEMVYSDVFPIMANARFSTECHQLCITMVNTRQLLTLMITKMNMYKLTSPYVSTKLFFLFTFILNRLNLHNFRKAHEDHHI